MRAVTDLMPRTSVGIDNTDSEPTSVNPTGKMKYWQQVQSEMPNVILNFSEDIINNIIIYAQLHDFALRCDIPSYWVDRAKEDYPMTQK